MIATIKGPAKARFLLLTCLLLSFGLHIGILFFLSQFPLVLTQSLSQLFHKGKTTPITLELDQEELAALDRNAELEEVFTEMVIMSPQSKRPFDLGLSSTSLALSPTEEPSYAVEMEHELPEMENTLTFLPLPIDKEKELEAPWDMITFEQSALEEKPSHPVEAKVSALPESTLSRIDLPHEKPEDALEQTRDFSLSVLPSQEQVEELSMHTNELEVSSALSQTKPSPTLAKAKESVVAAAGIEDTTEIEQDLSPQAQRDFVIPYYVHTSTEVDESWLAQAAATKQWSDLFDIQVKLLPSSSDEGYVFSIVLDPKRELSEEKMIHNIYFLIDASSSIERHKFATYKRAVLKALSSLREGDRFNILFLDRKITKMSPQCLLFNNKSLHIAEEFLEKQSSAIMISMGDLFSSLNNVFSEINSEEDQIHTAVLLSNGKTSKSFANQQKALKTFLSKNGGKLSFYTATVGQNNNVLQLDMLSSLSGGKLIYADTNASFPRKLANVVKDLHDPVVKTLSISLTASNPKASLSLLPEVSHLADIYSAHPYYIMGRMDRLCDVSLCIQGIHDDEEITIAKTISFQNAEQADSNMKKEWKSRLITVHYNEFLQDAKAKHLKEAKELLKSSYGRVPIE